LERRASTNEKALMAPRTERQETAASLAAELHRLGAAVINSLPLDPNAKLRFQVLDVDREKVLEKLASWEWPAVFVASLPRVTFNGMQAASVYEIALPSERQPVVDDRQTIYGEIAERKKTPGESEAMLKHLGYK
jgi:hypothetical protein